MCGYDSVFRSAVLQTGAPFQAQIRWCDHGLGLSLPERFLLTPLIFTAYIHEQRDQSRIEAQDCAISQRQDVKDAEDTTACFGVLVHVVMCTPVAWRPTATGGGRRA